MLTFVKPNQCFEEDQVVIRHELGHALAAFVLGFGVGRIAFARLDDMILAGGVRSRTPDNRPPERELDQSIVMRLLVGEIAGRKYLDMPLDEVCSDFYISHRYSYSYANSVTRGSHDDISKAISISSKYGQEWYTFLSRCHDEARTIVEKGWGAIESASVIVQKRGLPKTSGATLLIPSLEVIRSFEHSGSAPGRGIAVEVAHHELLGSRWLRLIRNFRQRVAKNLLVETDEFKSASFP